MCLCMCIYVCVQVVKTSPDYIYVQFESGKKGYVDDFELALVDDGKVCE